MAGRRTGSSQSQGGEEPSPSVSRRSGRSRGANQPDSPSIAPLPSESGQPAPSVSLPQIPEDSSMDALPSAQPLSRNTRPRASARQGGAPSQQTASGISGSQLLTQGRSSPSGTGTGMRGGRRGLPRADLGQGAMHFAPPTLSGDLPPVEEDLKHAGESGEGGALDGTFIWGTSISVTSMTLAVRRFLENFRAEVTEEEAAAAAERAPADPRPKYLQLILQSLHNGDSIVNVDTEDVRACDVDLYKKLVSYPRELMPIFDGVANDLAFEYGQHEQGLGIQDGSLVPSMLVRVYNLEKNRTIRDLNPEDIDKLVSVQGMVTRTTSIIPDLRVAYFKCQRCQKEYQVQNESGKVQEPEKCVQCGAGFTCALIHNMSIFANKQMVKMQEKPNDIPEGETPHAVNLYVYESNVDVCRPGDRVTITGIYRAVPIRVNPHANNVHTIFRTYIDAMHVTRDEKGRLFTVAAAKEAAAAAMEEGAPQPKGASHCTGGGSTALPSASAGGLAGTQDPFFVNEDDQQMGQTLGSMTMEQVRAREAEIRALSQDPALYDRLVASFAPNIWEMDDVKKGLLAQLFGGLGKSFPGGRVRGDINVLLVGDPSVSKSQLLSYVHALAPRGIYTSGKGSSAVGLTAYVSKDPETKELVLESGALVLSDRGICCIDEFDKMSDSARSMLHEAMEQQTVSVAKAGLISTLNARTSVCACANPIGSRYNPSLSVSENINLPPTLLTRFDLIYLMQDKVDEEKDRRLARHLISLYREGATGATRAETGVAPIDPDLLRDYIAYARARLSPRISDEAAAELITAYQTLRRDGRERKVVVATPRQLESMIRLGEALARMRLSEVVVGSDIKEAVRLWYTAMSGSASGEHGGIDLENITTGVNPRVRAAGKELPEELRRLLGSGRGGSATSVTELLEALRPMGVTREMLVVQLRQLSDFVTLDERTGVVRPRRVLGSVAGGAEPGIAAVEVA